MSDQAIPATEGPGRAGPGRAGDGLRVQLRVLYALILREMATRYGTARIGYIWGLLSPILVITPLYVLYSTSLRAAPANMPALLFLVTGYVTYQFFSSTMNVVSHAIATNRGILYFPQVTPLDLMISRMVLELLTYTVVLVIFSVLSILIEGPHWPKDLAETLVAFWSSGLFGAAFGMFLGPIYLMAPAVDRFVAPMMRFGFFLSGVLFTADRLPTAALDVLKWNPMIHPIEALREGWFVDYTSPIANLPYTWTLAVVFLSAGVVLERVARRYIGRDT